MPASNPGLTLTRIAAGEVHANRAVTFGGTTPNASGAKVLGVSVFDAVPGEPFGVIVSGTAIIEAGGAVAVGDDIIADAQGRAIPASGAAGERPFADALTAASGAGKLIEVILKR